MNIQSARLRKREDAKTSCFVAILTGRERHFWIHPDLLAVCMLMNKWQQQTNSLLVFNTINCFTPVDAARNEAVKLFLQSKAEWLLQIDNDVVPPANVLCVLDDIGDRKIAGLPYGMELVPGDALFAMATNRGDAGYELRRQLPGTGWSQVDDIGTGCFFVHRDVLSSLAWPWFECKVVGAAHTCEDFQFCDKARAAGFPVWTHSGFICAHHKTTDLTQRARFMAQFAAQREIAVPQRTGPK